MTATATRATTRAATTSRFRFVIALAAGGVALLLAACSDAPLRGSATRDASHVRGEAVAVLAPRSGSSASGRAVLQQMQSGVHLSADFSGLTPGSRHGFHLHERGDCSAADASSAGGHFNPESMPHGQPFVVPHHAGDLPNVQADASGHAHVEVDMLDVTLNGKHPILGRALVLHAQPDDYRSQPAGNSGARIACGVIAAR